MLSTNRIKRAFAAQFVLVTLIGGALFFLPAGSFGYWQAWVYVSILLIPAIFAVGYFLRHDPLLLENRLRIIEKDSSQKVIMNIAVSFYALAFLIPGLDFRFGWSSVSPLVVIIASAIVFVGYRYIFLVFKENSYASRTIEVQQEQKVVSTGPYRIVRHPMYLGVLIIFLATPFALGSVIAFIPFLLIPIVLVLRILHEERFLLEHLEGYKEYVKRIKYRLVPGIW